MPECQGLGAQAEDCDLLEIVIGFTRARFVGLIPFHDLGGPSNGPRHGMPRKCRLDGRARFGVGADIPSSRRKSGLTPAAQNSRRNMSISPSLHRVNKPCQVRQK
jgi:hypothetical protein